MAYFGLNVNRNLTEVPDGRSALLSLGLDTRDLDVIKGLTDPYNVVRSDFRALSGLDFDLEKVANSLRYETSQYDELTSFFYDENAYVDTNLNINGQLAAAAIKYIYVDFTTAVPTIKTADISTSRVSSWSSFANPPQISSPIFYGGQVKVTNGILEFSKLNIRTTPIVKRFDSEIPTHKIKLKLGIDSGSGYVYETVYVFAMKGIPLTYVGYFRNASLSFTKNNNYPVPPTANGFKPSWVIKNLDNNYEIEYKNVLSGSTSSISVLDTTARQREIQIYYPVDGISSITLTSISLVELPNVNLPSLTTLNISSNDLREFPNLIGYTSLLALYINYNNLTRSPTPELRSFGPEVVARIPTSIQHLFIGNCFDGSHTADLSSLNKLVTFNASTGTNNRRLTGTAPEIYSGTVQTYDIRGNLFTALPDSVKNSTVLRFLYIDENRVYDTNFTIASQELEAYTSYYGNRHNLLNVAGRTKLKVYAHYSINYSGGVPITNIFTGCAALTSIVVMYSPVSGAMPQFSGCTSLQSVDFYSTNIQDAAAGYVLTSSTFDSCRGTLRSFRIYSAAIGFYDDNGTIRRSEIEYTTFNNMKSLSSIYISSLKQGIAGVLPNFSTALNLTSITLFRTYITGSVPNFASNLKLNYLYLNDNEFTGAVPSISSPVNFQYLYLSNNKITTFDKIESPKLTVLHLAYNKINNIPDMSNLTRLQEFKMNNQQLSGTGYTRVSYSYDLAAGIRPFAGMIALRSLDISSNNISQGHINQIIKDLNTNYDTVPRTGVYINLRGNAAPSTATAPAVQPADDIPSILAKLRGAGWTILTN